MRTILTTALTLVLAGCNVLPTSLPAVPASGALSPVLAQSGQNPADIYPLAQGMRWDYRLTQYKGGQPTGRIDTMSSEVVMARQTAEGWLAKVDRRYGQMALPPTEALVTAKGVRLARWQDAPALDGQRHLIADGLGLLPLDRGGAGGGLEAVPTTDGEITTSLDILRYPLTLGGVWDGRLWTFAKETLTSRGWQTITVPAGTYKAWHVTHRIAYEDGRTNDLAYWYAPGVGMIKAHEESTLVMNGQPATYAVDGALTAHRSPARP